MAVCPTQSITAGELSYEKDFFDLPMGGLGECDFFNFLSSRRSVRNFQDKPVPREMLQRIIDAVTLAPMGFPPHKVEVTVVQNRAMIKRPFPSDEAVRGFEQMDKESPGAVFMKRKMVRNLSHHQEPPYQRWKSCRR
jgi:nitroreductase